MLILLFVFFLECAGRSRRTRQRRTDCRVGWRLLAMTGEGHLCQFLCLPPHCSPFPASLSWLPPRLCLLTPFLLSAFFPVEPRFGAWYDPGQNGRGASAVCGATRTGPTPIAATLVLPIDSPPARGVQRTLPLVAFLWSPRTVSFPDGKEMGLDCAGRSRRTRQGITDCHVG